MSLRPSRNASHQRCSPEHFETLESRVCLSASTITPTPHLPSDIYPNPVEVTTRAGSRTGRSFLQALYRRNFRLDPITTTTTTTTTTTDTTPTTTPTTPTTTTTTPTTTTTTTPTTTPTGNTTPVSISQVQLGTTLRLVIVGTSDNDSILVTQSGNTLTVVANTHTTTYTGAFGEIAIFGQAGNDSITVNSSVSIASLLYGGAGTNTLTAAGTAKSYIISLGAGTDTLTGNGVNTSFWADTADTVNASTTETAGGDVHRISTFYQPWTTNSASSDYVSTTLNSPDLRDPNDSGSTTKLTGSLWGSGPSMFDVNQGALGDCYYLADLESLAFSQPGKLQEMAVDLGDGTYAVMFKRNGVSTYVRVDADMPTGPWNGLNYNHPQYGGAIWASIMEKAYAYFRSGANTWSSLNWGWTGTAFNDLGISTTSYYSMSSSLFSTMTTALANNKAIALVSTSSGYGAIIGSHAYAVVATSVESGVQYVTLRNPWGVDGAGSDGNPNDGLVKITFAQFQLAFSGGNIQV